MQAFSFEGKGFEYFKIWIVNILLTIVTVGLYYPWAKVRTNRYFYANSTLEGRNFEYHATGKQLFIGYLISMVLLIVYVTVQNISPTGSVILLLVFLAAFPWIIWRSLKFNMRVSSFSNVRFGFEGKLGGAYFIFMLLPVLTFLAIYAVPIAFIFVFPLLGVSPGGIGSILFFALAIAGFALAVYMFGVMKKKSYSYTINGSRYGQGKFATDLAVGPFVGILFKTIGLSILIVIVYIVVIAILGFVVGTSDQLLQVSRNLSDPEVIGSLFHNPAIIVMLILVYAGFLVISLAGFAYSTSRQRAYVYDNTRLDGEIAFKSTVGARQLAWVSITNLLVIMLTVGLATPWAAVRMARLYMENTQTDTSIGFDSYITQKQKEQSSLGEQIGDAFDVEVGVGF